MKNATTMTSARWVLIVSLIWLCAAPMLALSPPQDEQSDTRRLWDSSFFNLDKVPQKGKSTPSGAKHKPPSSDPTRTNETSHIPTANVVPDTVLGITLWRSQFSASETARILKETSAAIKAEQVEKEFAAVTADTIFQEGDLVRLTIEAARDGYLYVIDREQYDNGSFSAPYLIFPNPHTGLENNRVKKAQAFDVPSTCFMIERLEGSSVKVAEELIVIVHPDSLLSVAFLNGLKFEDGAAELNQADVAKWETAWGGEVGRLETAGSVNQRFARHDGQPGDSTRILKQKDPLPQVVYYNPKISLRDPLLVKLRLTIGAAKVGNN